MKKLLLILLCLPLLFTTCKKEESTIEIDEQPTIYNAWQLTIQSSYLTQGTQYTTGVWIDSLTGGIYTGQIQYLDSGSTMVSNDTIFPGVSTNYSSRIWSINENQVIIDTYYDGNGFSYNVLQHAFTKNLDTLVVNFQSGDIKTFIINELTADHFDIISIPDTNTSPLFDINGIYQDTVLINITSDKYFFDTM